jgi:hypothetical protein
VRFNQPSRDKEPNSEIPNPDALHPHHPPADRQADIIGAKFLALEREGPGAAGLVFSLGGSDAAGTAQTSRQTTSGFACDCRPLLFVTVLSHKMLTDTMICSFGFLMVVRTVARTGSGPRARRVLPGFSVPDSLPLLSYTRLLSVKRGSECERSWSIRAGATSLPAGLRRGMSCPQYRRERGRRPGLG